MGDLVIIESPNKIKKIKSYLNAEIMATVGHFMDLPEDSMGVDLDTYKPTFVYTIDKRDGSEKGKRVSAQIKKLAANADRVFIATDPDREGYAIGTFCHGELKGMNKNIFRLEIHVISKKGIEDAMKKAIPFDQTNKGFFDAFLGRRVGDRVVGYIMSQIVKEALRSKIEKGQKISVGRVQAPAVFLVEIREREIRDFKPSKYWAVSISLDKAGTVFKATHKNGTFKDEAAAKQAFAAVTAAQTAQILKIETKETFQNPKAPFTTVDLQVTSNSQLKISPERTMAIAQELFEHGLISYHRTDSVRIADEFIAEIRDHVTNAIGPLYVPKTPNQYSSKNSQADAHEAIRPSHMHALGDIPSIIANEQLGPEHEKVYTLIYKRTVASQMAAAVYDSTSVDLECGGEPFQTNGRVLKFDGFLSLYTEAKDEDDDSDPVQKLPKLVDGESVAKVDQKNEEKLTKAPSRYNEGTLVKALEKYGIGRPSTYAQTMATIKARGYIQLVKGKIHSTPLAAMLIDYLQAEHAWLIDLELTKRMEDFLDQVQDGTANWVAFVKGVHAKMNYAKPRAGGNSDAPPTPAQIEFAKKLSEKQGIAIPDEAMKNIAVMSEWLKKTSGADTKGGNSAKSSGNGKGPEEIGKCPKCGKTVRENTKSFYCSGYFDKENKCTFSVWKNRLEKMGKPEITAAQMKSLLGMKPVDISGFAGADGKAIKQKCLLKEDPKFGWGVQIQR